MDGTEIENIDIREYGDATSLDGVKLFGHIASTGDGVNVPASMIGSGHMLKSNPTGAGYLSINRKDGTSVGSRSAALNDDNEASGMQSLATGYVTRATGQASASFGTNTTASGKCAHAEGEETEARAYCAHAEGFMNVTTDDAMYAHVEGANNAANNMSEHAEGRFNTSHRDSKEYGSAGNTIHSVGVGTSMYERRNALEIMQNGDVYMMGVGKYDGTSVDHVMTVAEAIAEPKKPVYEGVNTGEWSGKVEFHAELNKFYDMGFLPGGVTELYVTFDIPEPNTVAAGEFQFKLQEVPMLQKVIVYYDGKVQCYRRDFPDSWQQGCCYQVELRNDCATVKTFMKPEE